VIGFDLDNEPHNWYGHNDENWGKGGPDDIRAMYTNTGNAIHEVNPGALIICEAFCDVTDKSSPLWWYAELTGVGAKPVLLKVPYKVVYSVHEYPDPGRDIGAKSVALMNTAWGYIVKQNIAPVWIGEMGDSMDQAAGGVSAEHQNAWAQSLIPYLNGQAPDGPRFSANEQPISTSWWWWNYVPDEVPDGCLTKDGQLNPAQAGYIEQLQFWPKHGN
jgi:hypothetical protein